MDLSFWPQLFADYQNFEVFDGFWFEAASVGLLCLSGAGLSGAEWLNWGWDIWLLEECGTGFEWRGVALLREHDRLLAENQSDYRLDAEIKAIDESLRYVKGDLEKVKLRELTMTIVAPTSAGKSTIINAIAGQ